MTFKATTFAVLLAVIQAKTDSIHERKLISKIAGYQPVTIVTDANAIDQDQRLIDILLGSPVAATFTNARKVYELGANVGSYALLKLQTNPLLGLTLGESVTGTSVDGSSVTGTLDEIPATSSTTGEIEIMVRYDVSQDQDDHVGCRVGGHPDPVTDGCFQAEGEVTFGSAGTWSYTYDVEEDNKNSATIQSFSTNANSTMKPADSDEYFVHFQKYVDYYGTPFYADEWVSAALNASATTLSRGNADFRSESYTARAQAVKRGTATMNIAMYVIRQLEAAVDDCQTCATADCADDAVNSIDTAVALYTGSFEGTDYNAEFGALMYGYADFRCTQFRTCGELLDLDTGISYVNRRIFDQFESMQRNLETGDCNATATNKDRIIEFLIIPLIQSVLKVAYKKSFEQFSNSDVLEGATYAASILPLLQSCSSDVADFIYENMQQGQLTTDFLMVKSALESQYECLGITCPEVGGIWDGSAYKTGAEPCVPPGIEEPEQETPFLDFLQSISLIFLAFLALIGSILLSGGIPGIPIPGLGG